ncbi:UNVERIFIED_CONTAM: Long-chain-fatty-acid--AMP ligase FadD26 [Sesamum radiatum]|uniref:Long-chain-fatty-acid--AMP ligase FadD26 n=1 Tax=Sesamum radiatum TaxID=300843 RepID=A0AAW2M2X9_SESRA
MNHENYDLCFPDQPVVDLYLPIWANLPAFRHKPAFVWAEEGPAHVSDSSALTYEQLNASVQSISSQLLLSLQRGDTVVILCAPGLEFVEIIFACQRAGLLAVPVVPPHPSFASDNHHHLVRVLSQAKPKAALAARSYINRVREYAASSNNKLSDLLQTLRWIETEDIKVQMKVGDVQRNSSRYLGCKANDVYLIQYTSGATGIPKPVLVTAGAAAHNVRVARRAYDLHPNSVIVSWLPQYHDCGLMFLLLTIVSGATRGGVDKGTSSINLGSMKNLIIINEPIYKASVEEFVEVFRPYGLNASSISPSYGLAENCTFVSTAWRSESNGNFPVHKSLLPSAKLPSSREEIMEEEIEILVVNEETHEPADDGVEGEIWISSPSNASGYLGHPTLTHEVFNARLRNKVAGCFVRTQDRGIVMGHERYLYITGRASDIIKQADGQEIHAHYIETAAYKSGPRLIRAGCLAAFEFLGSVAIVAELQRGVETSLLMKICEGIRDGVLKEEKIGVGAVVIVESGSVPKTTSGKVQRWLAKAKLERGEMNVVMKMEFGCNPMLFGRIMEEGSKEGKKVNFLTTSNTRNHLSLLSSL